MALPDRFIEELSQRNNIEDVVSSYISLRPRGRTRVGLCPFHGEKTPSFTVYPENNSFYCYGCGAGGDVITFIKKIERLDYMDAVRFLADRAGMEMPRTEVDDTASKLRRRILEANRDAARFFHSMLYSPEGRHALNYYYSRGYTDKTIRRFGLGYAPDSFSALLKHLREKGYREDELLLAWLVRRSQKGSVFDSFRNRVIVPIIDVRGNVIAFGGRVLDDSKPKYLNTGDTPVFKKTNNLFALNIAKESGRQLILCEGYMDVIALHQAGFPNAVAALGTSFTAEHANLIARYADEVILIFDSDEAGQKGASRAMGLLRRTGVRIRVVRIPDGKDPDEFLRHHPPEAFKLLIERSANDVEYRLTILRSQFSVDTTDGKVQYINEAVKIIATLQNSVERDVYISRLSNEFGVSKSAITDQVSKLMRTKERKQSREQLSSELKKTEQIIGKVNPEALKYVRAAAAEEALIGSMLLHPDRIGKISSKLSCEDMITPFNKRLYHYTVQRHSQGLLIELSIMAAEFNDDEMAYITLMLHNAQTRAEALSDMMQYVDIIQSEKRLSTTADVSQMSDEELRMLLETLRNMKQ